VGGFGFGAHAGLFAVEDVIGADVDEAAAVGIAEFGDPAGGEAIDLMGQFRFVFAKIDLGDGCGIDDEVGWLGFQGGLE